jgi:hypothetical protein
MAGIKHPTWNRNLKSLRNFDDQNLLSASAEGTYHFNFRTVKRMVPVVDLLPRELVSSVGRRYARREARRLLLAPDTLHFSAPSR